MSPARGSTLDVPFLRAHTAARAVVALLIAGSLLGLGARSAGAQAVEGQIIFHIEQNGGIRVTLGAFQPLGSTLIAPGTYSVILRNENKDPEGRVHGFNMLGPGVQLAADANQGEQDDTVFTFNFFPSASYSWIDGPSGQTGVIRTAAVAAPNATPSSSVTSGGTGPPPASVKKTALPAATLPFQGTLQGSVTKAGKLALAFKGRPVTALRLPTGSYKIVVVDRSKTVAFSVQRAGKPAVTVTGLPFTGTKSVTLDLTAGKWAFYSTIYKQSKFVVS